MNIQTTGKTQPHGEQEERKLQAAKELLQQTDQGRNLGTTENVSKGLSQVGQTLNEGARNAPDRQSAQVVSDMANLVDATQKLVQDKDIPDRMNRIAEEARLAAKEQDLNKGKLRDVGNTAQRQMQMARPAAEVLQENVMPLLRYVLFSRKFRVLVLDLISIFRKIILRSVSQDEEGSEFKEQMKEEWKEGAAPSDMAREVKDRVNVNTKNAQGEREVPVKEEEIDRLIDDIADVISVIASDPKYHDAVQRLFEMGECMYSQVQEATQGMSTAMPHTQKLKQETKDLVADVSGREPLNRFLDRLDVLSRRLRDDQEARNYLQEFKEFLLAQHPESTSENKEFFKNKIRDLIERGRQIFDKWNNSNEVEDFLNASNDLVESMKNDSQLNTLQQTAGILMDDFTTTDAQGKTVLDTNLIANVQRAIVPALADALKYIPIPMIEYHDYAMDFTARDIVLCGYDIIPERFSAHLESDSSVSFKELETQKFMSKFVLTIQGIRTEIKDINFTYRRKIFPEIDDAGQVTLRMTRRGANLKFWFYIRQGETLPQIEKGGVDFDIDSIALDFNKATIKHDVLLPMMSGLFKRQIIRAIEKSVENTLEPIINTIRSQLSENNPLVSRFSQNLERLKSNVKSGDVQRTLQERQEKLKHT